MKEDEYLNSMLISRFYLQTIHKTKNTTKIIIIKIKKLKKYKDKERRIIPFNMLKTSIKTITMKWETHMIKYQKPSEDSIGAGPQNY